MTYDPNAEPTHPIPKELEGKLTEAKQWYDCREDLEATIRSTGGFAERNQEDRDASDREAAGVLAEIIEVIDETWGWGPKAHRS